MKNIILNILKVFLVLMIIFIMILGGVFGAAFYKRWESEFNADGKGTPGITIGIIGNNEVVEQKECITCLFMGVNGPLTDFLMLGQYNPNNKSIALLSIPRDTQVKSAYDWKINSLYGGKHPEKTIKAVEGITGVQVQHYVVFDTKILRKLVDEIGGVTVDVPINMDYDDPYQNLHIHLKKGVQKLNGNQAEQFVRFRKNNNNTGYVDGDEGRIRAQHSFIKAMISEVLSPKGLAKMKDLVKIVLEGTKTDVTMDLVTEYLDDAVTIKLDKIQMDTLPGAGRMGPSPYGYDLSYFYHDTKKTEELIETLFKGVEGSGDNGLVPTPTSPVEKVEEIEYEYEDNGKPRIEVLNANNSSKMLNSVVVKLNSGDFDVAKIGNYATSKVEQSRIIDYGIGTDEELTKLKELLKITKVEKVLDQTSRVKYTVIIGEKYQ